MRTVALAALMLAAATLPSHAEPRHGLSIFGDLKYPANFTHFEYVDPAAPKGGALKMIGTGANLSFDSFNNFIVKGDPAQGLGLVYDSLMERATDEPDAVYGLIAATADLAADKKSIAFKLRPEARFADGTPVTAEDVVFTLDMLKEHGRPQYAQSLRDVAKAEALDPLTVRFVFQGTLVRDLPTFVASLPVIPKAFYKDRKFEDGFLDRPLGSGPYEVGEFKQGSYVTYKRRPDYWAKDLPVNRGRGNFDAIRYEYYRERTASLEALKAGVLNFREEFSSRDWATAYDSPQFRDGRIIKERVPDELPSGTQGWFLNLRRDKFKDPRVRLALDYAFDFEWTKKTIFYGEYERVASYFENSDMKATGTPSPEEMALLEPWRGKVPDEVFGEVYVPPKSDGSGQDRALLKTARDLLKAAGYIVKNGVLTGPGGEPFTLEYLDDDDASERYVGPFIKNLKQLGIEASLRVVDSSQYQNRLDSYNFDMAGARFVGGQTPGVDLRDQYSSASARKPGSFNLAGIENPAVDDLIEKIILATSRNDLNTAARALDRVLRAGHYWVPNWYGASHRIAYWDTFARPAIKPRYDLGAIDTWWIDPAKAGKLAGN